MLVWEESSRSSSLSSSSTPPLALRDVAESAASERRVPDMLAAQAPLAAVSAAAVMPRSTPAAADASASSTANTSTRKRRVNVADKRIINAQTDVNQLVPFKYKW